MTSQITNVLLIVVLAIVAVCQGISAGVDWYAKNSKKPLPKEVLTIDQIAKFVVSEASTLDISGAEKKAKAVQALLEQAEKLGKPVTETVAKGAVQHAYNEAKKANGTDDDKAEQIGFVDNSKDGE